MSDFTVIRAVSDGLRDVLANHLSGYFTTVTVDLRSPREMGPADMLIPALFSLAEGETPDVSIGAAELVELRS